VILMPAACEAGVLSSCAQSPHRDWSGGVMGSRPNTPILRYSNIPVSGARLASAIVLSNLQAEIDAD
jgi:hypothetical protein